MFNAIQKKLILIFLALIFVGLSSPDNLWAREKKSSPSSSKKRDPGQYAIIIVDGAAVYTVPNFDSPVKEYLDRGKRYKVSTKVYPGIGGLGAFYKILLKRGVFGYITDVDVEISSRKAGEVLRDQDRSEIENDPLKIQEDLEDSTEDPEFAQTLYLNSFTGVSLLTANYTETVGAKKRSSATPMIGFRRSGPTSYMGGMPLDLELAMTNQVPALYDSVTSSRSGYLFLGSALAMFPLSDQSNKLIYYAFGPSFKYSRFDLNLTNTPSLGTIQSHELALGAEIAIGAAFKVFSTWCLRLDARYNYENEGYSILSIAIQK